MNEDGPDVSPYGTLVKHDQSETKRDKPRGVNAAPDIPCFFVELDFPTAKLDLDKVQKVCTLCL
jgi:hypothetical protein